MRPKTAYSFDNDVVLNELPKLHYCLLVVKNPRGLFEGRSV